MVTQVLFEVEGAGTRVTITQGPHTPEMHDQATSGWGGALDKLERRLC